MEERFDYFVIGAGSAGVRSARIAAEMGAKVGIAEESRYGGTCVVRGCIPKKLFVYASEYSHRIEDAKGYGWDIQARFDWHTLRDNKDKEIQRLTQIYMSLLDKNKVLRFDGRARLRSANEVEVNGRCYHADKILIATGGRPLRPEIPGAELGFTSNEAFHLEALPKHITIVGGGYIGLEFSSIFRGLGCQVAMVHHRKEALRGFDEDIRHHVTNNLRENGVELLLETEVEEIRRLENDRLHFICSEGDHHETDAVMFATGRKPNTEGLGLAEIGVELGERGGVLIDEHGKSSVDSIYAAGDCTDRLQLTPVAIREGHAIANTLFGATPTRFEHPVVPTAIFTQPEAATVGLTEAEARAQGEVDIYRSEFRPLFHTVSGRNERVMLKLVVMRETSKVVGAHMVGSHAGDIIQVAAIAIGMGATKEDFDRTVALHPCSAEELVLMRKPVES